ncbi:MAG: methylated-DNA-[protein]-cysteine S-methyltransferase [Actinomycetota bacterium]|jgi:methylated-DNA-[protein]-cysteine S-methyltransferase|nr:methylated-DNA-[protein]-cysteine S-methyltransferase [Actinomycetota bacterium]
MRAASYFTETESPIGRLTLTSDEDALTGLYVEWDAPPPPAKRDAGPFAEVTDQLDRYWAGESTTFDVPLAPSGTPFQLSVWNALLDIPYGETISYRMLAERIGNPRAVRAVGAANGRNPISIIIPCHRVIGASGALVGYGWGLDRKRQLLDLESGVLV